MLSGIKPLVGTAVYLKRDGVRMCGSAQAWQPGAQGNPEKCRLVDDDRISVSRD